MRQLAIMYERISLGDNKFAFKPIRTIEGKYNERTDTFTTLKDKTYSSCSYYDENQKDHIRVFGNVEDIKDVQDYYDDCNSNSVLKKSFLDDFSEAFILGVYDRKKQEIVMGDKYKDEILFEAETDEEEDVVVKTASKPQPKAETKPDPSANKDIDLAKLRKEVLSVVKGQDEAVRKITLQLAKNYKYASADIKNHIIIAGPSGTGKTEIVTIIKDIIGVPCVKVDATSFTKEGYMGSDVDEMLISLINECNGDIKKAENGILIIDEIDKKAATGDPNETISSKDVQSSLLKILGRSEIEVDIGTSYSPRKVKFDTSKLTVIVLGAFADMLEKLDFTNNKNGIGFGSNMNDTQTTKKHYQLQKEDFIKYGGMIPELMGRIPCMVATRELLTETLEDIIVNGKKSEFIKNLQPFKDEGIDVQYDEEFIHGLALLAKKMGVGARGIADAVNYVLTEAQEECFVEEKPKVIRLTKHTIEDNTKYEKE